MDDAMNHVVGRVPVTVAGEERQIAVDMLAADALFEQHGEHWTAWLYGAFIANPVRDGESIRFSTPPLPPSVVVKTLHALLAGDRQRREYGETAQELFDKIDPLSVHALQGPITKAVLASLGVPGEEVTVSASAAGDGQASHRAKTPGTGTRR